MPTNLTQKQIDREPESAFNVTFEDMPKYHVNIQLKNPENMTGNELMKFKSELSAQIDTTREVMIDYRSLKTMIE